MIPVDLSRLYNATEEDLRYGIGTLALADQPEMPVILVRYTRWSLEQLRVVRESFQEGVILVHGRRPDGSTDLYLGTRQTIQVQVQKDGHTSVLRAPAWDAHLAHVDSQVYGGFEAQRQQTGGFLLLMQAGAGEFLTVVDEVQNRALVGVILPEWSLNLPDPLAN